MDIPQTVFDLYNQTADDFIDKNFGVNCILTYGTNKTKCPNCILNEMTGTSLNKYQAGGPIPFDTGMCPYCNGVGFIDEQATETIKLRVYFEKKYWIKLELPIHIKDGAIQTIGHIEDLPKCKMANKITVCSDIKNYNQYDFVLAGDPVPHGFKKNRYFIAYWNRTQ